MSVCPHCGDEVADGARLCPNCGSAAINLVWPPPVPGAPGDPNPGPRGVLIGPVVDVILGILAALGLFALGGLGLLANPILAITLRNRYYWFAAAIGWTTIVVVVGVVAFFGYAFYQCTTGATHL